eukprot:gene13684-15738_t
MNPTSKIMAFRVGKILQLFDLEEQAVVKSHNSPDPVVYWRWATPNCVALVTSVAVFHWSLEDDAPPVKIFDRHPTLTQKRSTITNYHVSEDGKLCLLCSTHFVKASGVLEGFMQLYSIDRAVSQILQGHTGVFALLKLPDRAQVLLVDHKPNSESVFKLHIHEVGYDTATCGGEKFRADPGVIPVSTDAPGDYPVSMIVAKKTCLLYMVTKMGFVHVFDGFTGSLLCSTRVTRHDVLCVTAHAPTGGIFVISNIGKVLQVHIELSLLVPYLVLQLANEPLAVKVAVRLDLPEVNNLFTTRFESLLNAGDVKGAISTAVNSPHDCLRIPATMERLKSVSVGTGQPKPLYQFLYMLMENGKLNQSESLELARSATVSGRTQPLEKIFLEDKLSVSMELVSLVLTYDEKLALVMGRTQSDITVINYFLRQKEYDKLLIYARISQCKVDYVVQFERSVRNDRQGALNFAKSLARAKLIDPTVVVDLFVKAYQRRDATLFLQEVLTTNRSDQGALQTKLWTASRALELYTEVADIKRVLLTQAVKLSPYTLPINIRLVPPDQLLEVLTTVLKQDPAKNVRIIARIAVKFRDVFDVKNVIRLFEECKAHEGMFEFLDPIVDASNDPLVHLKYIVAAAHLKRHKEVVRLCKGTPVFDPAAVITCLIEAKLPDAFLLIHICDLFGYVDEMTTYLFNNNLQYEVEDYLRTCPGPEALKVLGKLMDLKCSDTILSKLIALLGHRVSIVEVIHAAESRNALCSVRPWLEKIAWRSVDPVVHTAMAKIYIMLNDKPLQFLHSNLYYDSLTVGTFFEKSHPYFACAAYARANGKCDAQLLRVAQENNDYKNLTRYLIQRQDMVLWQKALIPDNYKPGDPTPISRRSLVSEVICVLPEIQVYNEVFAIANAYSQCNMIEENIQLLECVVSSGGKFAKDPHLQTLLIRTAIQFKKEKVVGYINCLSFFDGPVLAEVAVKPENALYEEALVIYLKLSQNIWSVDRTRYCIAAVDVLINHLGDLNRAREFAQQVNVKEVHSRVIHAQNQALRAPPVAKVAAVQPAPPAPLAPLAPPAPPILPAASVCAEMPSSWLVVRLLANGFDVELVKDCDQKLVVKEGFISESDFADC